MLTIILRASVSIKKHTSCLSQGTKSFSLLHCIASKPLLSLLSYVFAFPTPFLFAGVTPSNPLSLRLFIFVSFYSEKLIFSFFIWVFGGGTCCEANLNDFNAFFIHCASLTLKRKFEFFVFQMKHLGLSIGSHIHTLSSIFIAYFCWFSWSISCFNLLCCLGSCCLVSQSSLAFDFGGTDKERMWQGWEWRRRMRERGVRQFELKREK